MKRKPQYIQGCFGKTIAALRKARGLTQKELAAKIKVSQRMITYYECESTHPPVAILPDLARVLHVSVEQLLGVKPINDPAISKDKRLLRRVKFLEDLSEKDQHTVLSLIKSLRKQTLSKNI